VAARSLLFVLLFASLDAVSQRTIAVTMDDTMRYDPSEITVKAGEKLRFVATNRGKLVHEMVIGTKKELEDHAKHMREHPQMQHDGHAGALKLDPGRSGEMAYTFNRAGTFYYGCLEPGHLEAGMIGKVVVQ